MGDKQVHVKGKTESTKSGASTDRVEIAASRLRSAEAARRPCAPIRDVIPDGDVDAAYAAQRVNCNYWAARGRRVIGRKVGLTSKVVQAQLGVDQPDFGVLFADMAVGDGEEIMPSRVLQPRIEAEIALVLDHTLSAEMPTIADVLRATAYAVPALEIVSSRIANWDITLVDTIADNASSGLFVLGGPARRLAGLELRDCAMTLERGGDTVSEGLGATCLGHPLNAAVWLAAKMVELGVPLGPGDVVLTGALGPMVPVVPGDIFDASISELGSVRAIFANEATI